jgi:hypothetical protein
MSLLNNNGEWKSSLTGTVLIVGSNLLLVKGFLPWEASFAATGVGLYLLLPARLRTLGDWLVATFDSVMETWRNRNG